MSCFQSQLGSIGAPLLPPLRPPVARFQSQLGSIGALFGPFWVRLSFFELSIPAWFDWRVEVRGHAHSAGKTFNPSLVRLARVVSGVQGRDAQTFQSQLGSIGAIKGIRGVGLITIFQSQLGSIGACVCGEWEDGPSAAFNPSLVRLARLGLGQALAVAVVFQSQLGSIGAMYADVINDFIYNLSIPAWFDWRAGRCCSALAPTCLSIPAWFDWRWAPYIEFTPIRIPFNPSLVRLARQDQDVHVAVAGDFQSQLGSIGAS